MSTEAIIARILSDADGEAEEIVRRAEEEAEKAVSAAKARADEELSEAKAEAEALATRIREGKEAAARLESAKILLAEKRRALDEIYARALGKLLSLGERDSLALVSRLIEENAEEGDELVFAKDYAHSDKAAKLPVVKKLGLTVSEKREGTGGGFFLCGKLCDREVTFAALLERDREERQAEIAAKLFPAG